MDPAESEDSKGSSSSSSSSPYNVKRRHRSREEVAAQLESRARSHIHYFNTRDWHAMAMVPYISPKFTATIDFAQSMTWAEFFVAQRAYATANPEFSIRIHNSDVNFESSGRSANVFILATILGRPGVDISGEHAFVESFRREGDEWLWTAQTTVRGTMMLGVTDPFFAHNTNTLQRNQADIASELEQRISSTANYFNGRDWEALGSFPGVATDFVAYLDPGQFDLTWIDMWDAQRAYAEIDPDYQILLEKSSVSFNESGTNVTIYMRVQASRETKGHRREHMFIEDFRLVGEEWLWWQHTSLGGTTALAPWDVSDTSNT